MSFGRSGPHAKRLESGATLVAYNLGNAKLHTYIAPEKSFGNATIVLRLKIILW